MRLLLQIKDESQVVVEVAVQDVVVLMQKVADAVADKLLLSLVAHDHFLFFHPYVIVVDHHVFHLRIQLLVA